MSAAAIADRSGACLRLARGVRVALSAVLVLAFLGAPGTAAAAAGMGQGDQGSADIQAEQEAPEQEAAEQEQAEQEASEQEDVGDQERNLEQLERERGRLPSVFWDQGLHLVLPRARIHARFGGWIQADGAVFGRNNTVERVVGPLTEGAEIRRARLYLEGDASDWIEYRFQFEVTGLGGTLRDFFFGVRKLPFRVRIGHMREPLGLENTTSGRNTTFMERSLSTPQVSLFSSGVTVSNGSRSIFHLGGEVQRWTWALGVFQNSNSLALVEGTSKAISGRVTTLAFDGTGGDPLIHVGVSATSRWFSESDVVQSSQKPESNLAPVFLLTLPFNPRRLHALYLESALLLDRAMLQAEFVHSWGSIRDEVGSTFATDGFHVFGSYFLTDDQRVYRYTTGNFGPVYPSNPFPGGTGAIELATRLSTLDLDDPSLQGGKLTDWSVGVNWYWSQHTRWTFNYISAWLQDVGRVPVFQARLQLSL